MFALCLDPHTAVLREICRNSFLLSWHFTTKRARSYTRSFEPGEERPWTHCTMSQSTKLLNDISKASHAVDKVGRDPRDRPPPSCHILLCLTCAVSSFQRGKLGKMYTRFCAFDDVPCHQRLSLNPSSSPFLFSFCFVSHVSLYFKPAITHTHTRAHTHAHNLIALITTN